jgi:hypothetical protein
MLLIAAIPLVVACQDADEAEGDRSRRGARGGAGTPPGHFVPDGRDLSGATPVCGPDAGTRQAFQVLCEFAHRELHSLREVFIGGYAMRTLAAGSVLLEEPRYLSTAVAWAESLLAWQDPAGYWTTGYSQHAYLADAASALGLLFVLHPRVDADRRARYEAATLRFVAAAENTGLVYDSGAWGVGWSAETATVLVPFRDPYTIASSLAGAMVSTWLHVHTGEEHHRERAGRALRWILSTMREDGVIPYVLATDGADLDRADDPDHARVLYDEWRYDTSAYVGEGLIAFDRHGATPAWRAELREGIRPHVEFLLRSQNPDGSWGVPRSPDQKRSPGVANFLTWWLVDVEDDPRVRRALCRFEAFLGVREQARSFGIVPAGASGVQDHLIVTALTGRALASLLAPGIDTRW